MKITFYNCQNLFCAVDERLSQGDVEKMTAYEWERLGAEKPLPKMRALAQIIKFLNPDILGLCEVGGEESLQALNKLFLSSRYRIYFLPGNSDRNIHLGYLVKKELFKDVPCQVVSYRHTLLDPVHFSAASVGRAQDKFTFARDLLELMIGNLSIYIVHLKSQRDKEPTDPQGRDQRSAECDALTKIIAQREREGRKKWVLMGDFNGEINPPHCQQEFAPLRPLFENGAYSLIKNWTFLSGEHKSQLDYMLISQQMRRYYQSPQAKAFHYFHHNGDYFLPNKELKGAQVWPLTAYELPSDHCPISMRIKGQPW